MVPPPRTFLTAGVSVDVVATALEAVPAPARSIERTWYDTFDWRVWNEGMVLEVDAWRGTTVATLRSRKDHAVRWSRPVTTVPARAEDLPAGQWRRSLASVIGIRALVPVARRRLRSIALDAAGTAPDTRATVLYEDGFARVVPVEGAGARRVRTRLAEEVGLTAAPGHPLEAATPPGRAPGHYGGRLAIPLDAAMPADEAVRRMLVTLVEIMKVNEPWLAEPPDSEFLHDYRVALRRARSVLKQAGGIVAARRLSRWRAALRDLQRRTNAHRDLDVFLLEFDSYRQAVPKSARADLEPLHAALRARHATEHRRLVTYLGSRRYRDLLVGFDRFLAGPLPDDDAGDASRPVIDVAADRIRRAHRGVLRRGAAIDAASPGTELHRVRILGKELRYLLELYADLYPAKQLRGLVSDLKRLQDNLGRFQDGEVHAAALRDMAEAMQAGPKPPPAGTLMAMGMLADRFARGQAAARAEFPDSFAAFRSKVTADRVRRLVRR